MVKRKVVKQGASTFMVSLPKKWAKTQGLEKGQEVDITEVDNTLVICSDSHGQSQKKQTTITVNTTSTTRSAIVHAYRCGYDLIKINYSSADVQQAILHIINNHLIGFDISKRGENYCIIENITEPSEDQFDVLFKKIFYNISLLLEKTLDRIKNESTFLDYEDIMYKIYQYDNFCRRVISKKKLFGPNAPLMWAFLTQLIHGQRELFHFNKLLDTKKISFSHIKLFEDVKKCFELLRDSYLKKDVLLIEELHSLQQTIIQKKLDGLLQKSSKENILLFHLCYSLRHFYLASSPLIGLLLSEKKN